MSTIRDNYGDTLDVTPFTENGEPEVEIIVVRTSHGGHQPVMIPLILDAEAVKDLRRALKGAGRLAMEALSEG